MHGFSVITDCCEGCGSSPYLRELLVVAVVIGWLLLTVMPLVLMGMRGLPAQIPRRIHPDMLLMQMQAFRVAAWPKIRRNRSRRSGRD